MSGPNKTRKGDKPRPELPEALPGPVVDNHCHLDIAMGEWLSVEEALAKATQVNVTRIVQIGCDLRGARWAVETAENFPQIVAGVAIHPNDAPRLAEKGELEAAWVEIEQLASKPVVRAVGETGLDYFRTGVEGRPIQQESFKRHIQMAKDLDKTLVIHDRDSHDDVLAILEEVGFPERWVMHCFSGDAGFAREVTDRGWYCSFAGVVTFKSAAALREALDVVPRERILVETDAPFLAPVPHRGKPNASYLIPLTMRLMAEHVGEDLVTLCDNVRANTLEAFGDL